MATSALSPPPAPVVSSRRVVEWALVASVIAVVVLVFLQQQRVVHNQAEAAAVKATLGALRTAMLLVRLRDSVAGLAPGVVSVQRNPFDLLTQPPPNYAGELRAEDAVTAQAGSWVFDPWCRCIGYLPRDAQALSTADGARIAWFRVRETTGVSELVPMQVYALQGQRLD